MLLNGEFFRDRTGSLNKGSTRIDLPSDRGIAPLGSSNLKIFLSQELDSFNPRNIAVKLPKLGPRDR